MAWKDVPDSSQSEKIPPGSYDQLRITRVLRGPKDKAPFTAKDGSPQIMAIITDDQDREVSAMLTLSEKAAWVLKSYLVAIGADLDAMDRDGIDYRNFSDETFAAGQLCDRPFRGEVRAGKNPAYPEVIPFRPPHAGADAPDANTEPLEEELPI